MASVFLNADAGKGPITDKTYEGAIESIKVATSIKAEVVKSDTEKAVVSAPEDLMKYLKVEHSNGLFSIRVASGLGKTISTRNIKVVIYAKEFSALYASSSSSIKVKDGFKLKRLLVDASSSASADIAELSAEGVVMEASSSASLSGRISAESLQAEASSSGSISLRGKAVKGSFEASSSGSINAEGFTLENAVLQASSSGSITVGVAKSVTASANSAGGITILKRGPLEQINTDKNSGGGISIR